MLRLSLRRHLVHHLFFYTRRLARHRNPNPIPPHLSFAGGHDHFIVVPCLAIVANTPASYSSFDTTSPRDSADDHDMEPKFPPLIEAYPLLISLPPTFPVVLLPATLFIAAHLCINIPPINLRDYPHDHRAPASDQQWCARSPSIRTPLHIFPLISCSFPSLFSLLSILSDDLPFLMTIVVPCRLRHGCTRWRSSAQTDALWAGSG